MEIKNIDQLVREYKKRNPGGHFFDRDTLKFFGERMSDMRLLKDKVTVRDCCEEKHLCYVVSSLQRKDPRGPRRHYHYFDAETINQVIT